MVVNSPVRIGNPCECPASTSSPHFIWPSPFDSLTRQFTERSAMIRQRRLLTAAIAAVCSATLLLTACGSSSSPGGSSEDVGDPVAGGDARIIQVSEPRTLDPAAL